jgi:hypothetical protein
MKTWLSLAVLSVAAWWAAAAYAATSADDHLAEMKDCAVCKFLAEDPELMKDMTWECHKIKAGMLCVATVPKDSKEKFDAAHKKMMDTVQGLATRIRNGEKVKLCSFCQGMGALTEAGAEHEDIDTSTGSINLVTSNDSAVVAKIHALADKAEDEEHAIK